MNTALSETIIAICGFLGISVTSYFSFLKIRYHKRMRQQAEEEMSLRSATMDFTQFLHHWGGTVDEINKLMDETVIDRFLILRAWNGALDPRWTTACLQIRQGKQKIISYVHYNLDKDYRDRLKKLWFDDYVHFNVEEVPEDAGIRAIYEAEGVTAACWFSLGDTRIEASNVDSRALTYCSFATHKGEIDNTTFTRCKIIADRLRGVASSFD